MWRRGRVAAAIVLALMLAVAGAADAKKKKKHKQVQAPAASTLARPADPVVLAGTDLPRLLGTSPGDLVAYRYQAATPKKHKKKKRKKHRAAVSDASTKKHRKKKHRKKKSSAGWVRVPVQVDERAVVDFGAAPPSGPPTGAVTVYGSSPAGAGALQYTDPNTFVGPDPDPTIDSNDEVSLMASDAGPQAPSGAVRPSGTDAAQATQLTVTDPQTGGTGYVYLFSATQPPGAPPADYVSYSFNLLSGPYKSTYQRNTGPNPEASVITTRSYTAAFNDRWFFDDLAIHAGGASNVDILDGYKFGFVQGSCTRSEATFNSGEGAFVANIDGPVRAIRSYVGANSGPYTERTHYFYADRQVIATDLRVHPIPGVSTQYDLSPAAFGMTYLDDKNPSGVTVDGNPDAIGSAPALWHLWRGGQGSLFIADRIQSSFAASFAASATAFYMDDSTPSIAQCWGDSQEIGAAGSSSSPPGGVPATAPPATDYLRSISTNEMLPPGETASQADALSSQLDAPLGASAAAYSAR